MIFSNISAIIVTKGDRDISGIVKDLPFRDIIVWDNSKEKEDSKVYGRYLAINRAKHNLIYTQDDDCIVDVHAIIKAYLGISIVCNMPKDRRREYYDGIQLVGWGSIFHKNLALSAFKKYLDAFPLDDLFLRECDRVFTYLNRCTLVDVPIAHLDYAHGEDRMGREARHGYDMKEIRRRLYTLPKNI